MIRSTARRYAEAAFEIAERDDSIDAWLGAFALAEDRLTGADVMRLLSNPSVSVRSRVEVLARLVGDEVGGAPRNLLALLIRRGRFELLPGVIREFRRLYRRREGIVEAAVTSASTLDEGTLSALQAHLAEVTGSQVELSAEVDPTLLGGIQVRVLDQLIDGSVRGRLERLRSDFSNIAI
jgi:F-type H+-transporting ATPase subunit delta